MKTIERGPIEVLTTAARPATAEEAHRLVRERFGLTAAVSALTSERDQNFLVREAHGARYVLKITNPAEDVSVTDFQTRALLHVASVAPDLPVQRIVPTVDGQVRCIAGFDDGTERVVRLLSYLPGQPLHSVAAGPALRAELARSLARLDLALRGFFHPAAGHRLLWDLKEASRLRELLAHIGDERRRGIAERFLDAFEQHAKPRMPGLRGQVVHNDLNPHNVLVDANGEGVVTGILDFGDMVHAPLINDLAVACSYQLGGGDANGSAEEALAGAAAFVSAYHAVLPLEEAEVDVVFDLIAARLVMTVAITGWRAQRYPENRAYILRNNPLSWDGLERLSGLARHDAQRVLRRACGMHGA